MSDGLCRKRQQGHRPWLWPNRRLQNSVSSTKGCPPPAGLTASADARLRATPPCFRFASHWPYEECLSCTTFEVTRLRRHVPWAATHMIGLGASRPKAHAVASRVDRSVRPQFPCKGRHAGHRRSLGLAACPYVCAQLGRPAAGFGLVARLARLRQGLDCGRVLPQRRTMRTWTFGLFPRGTGGHDRIALAHALPNRREVFCSLRTGVRKLEAFALALVTVCRVSTGQSERDIAAA